MTELPEFAARLRGINIPRAVSPVLSKAGAQMRDRARAAAPGGPYLPQYRQTIRFRKDGQMAVEMFAAATGQGNLGAILEFGQGPNSPHPHIIPQLAPEAKATAEWIGRVVRGQIRGGGA